MREIKDMKIEKINNDQTQEERIYNFNKLKTERKEGIEDVLGVLDALKEVAKAKKAYFEIKGKNISYYNEDWEICKGSLPSIFLDRITMLETQKIQAYSNLFSLVGGDPNSKITIHGLKSRYIIDILGKLEDITNLEFQGVRYSKLYRKNGMNFGEYCKTKEFEKVKNAYQYEWETRMKKIDEIIDALREIKVYAILNKHKGHMVEYAA